MFDQLGCGLWRPGMAAGAWRLASIADAEHAQRLKIANLCPAVTLLLSMRYLEVLNNLIRSKSIPLHIDTNSTSFPVWKVSL